MSLEIYIERIIQNDQTLTEIVLTRQGLTDDDIALLMQKLSIYPESAQRITKINLNHNKLTSLDLSVLTSLTELELFNNEITSFNLLALAALKVINFGANYLTSLDLSAVTELTELYLVYNDLTSIDVSFLTSLKILDLGDNKLTSIDVSTLTAMKALYLDNNQVTSIDVAPLTALQELYLNSNQITSIDVSTLIALTMLFLNDNRLTSINVLPLTALTDLTLGDNQLISLDVSPLTNLILLSLGNNQLTSIELSSLTALIELYLQDNNIKYIDALPLASLEILHINNNQLASLDISTLTTLEELGFGDEKLTKAEKIALNATKLILTNTYIIYHGLISNEIALTADIVKQHCKDVITLMSSTDINDEIMGHALSLDCLLPSDIASNTLEFLSPSQSICKKITGDIESFKKIFSKFQGSHKFSGVLKILNDFEEKELPILIKKIETHGYNLTHNTTLQMVSTISRFMNANKFNCINVNFSNKNPAGYTPLQLAKQGKHTSHIVPFILKRVKLQEDSKRCFLLPLESIKKRKLNHEKSIQNGKGSSLTCAMP